MKNKKLENFCLIIILVAVCFGVYFNSLHGAYLIDDFQAITTNHAIKDINVYFLKYFHIRPGVLWQVIEVINWKIGGGDPFVFHLFGLFVHIGNVLLLFMLSNLLFKSTSLSFLSALIFAVHPIHTEAVSWISGGHYSLSSFFFLASLIAYIKSEKSFYYILLTAILFVLCFLSGNAVATLPVMFIAFDLFFRKRKLGKKSLMRILFFLIFCLFSAIVILNFYINRNTTVHIILHFRGITYLVVGAKALVYYLKILYLPVQRGLFHPFAFDALNINRISPAFFGSLFIIVTSFFLFIKCLKKHSPISFGILLFYITFLPYSNIVPMCNVIAERYMYLPSVGFCICLAYLFSKVWEIINTKAGASKSILRIIAMTSIVIYILSYGILTVKNNHDFKDIMTFWETNINNFPNGYEAYNNLAGSCYTVGSVGQAISYCWITLLINPSQPKAWCNLGMIYRQKGILNLSKLCYSEALRYDKTYFTAASALNELEKEIAVKEKAGKDKKKKVEKFKKSR